MVIYAAAAICGPAAAVRIKDVVRPEGARDNQLVGYGLVVGLDGTGDSAQVGFTGQAVQNLVRHFGNSAAVGAKVKTKNAATVVITATMPPFVKPGDRIDLVVSSLGDARSLQGGVLLLPAERLLRLRGIRHQRRRIARPARSHPELELPLRHVHHRLRHLAHRVALAVAQVERPALPAVTQPLKREDVRVRQVVDVDVVRG